MGYRQVPQQGRFNQRGHCLGAPSNPGWPTTPHHIDATSQPRRAQSAQQPTGEQPTTHRQTAGENVRFQARQCTAEHAADDCCPALINPRLHLKLSGHAGQNFALRFSLQTVQRDQLGRASADLGV